MFKFDCIISIAIFIAIEIMQCYVSSELFVVFGLFVLRKFSIFIGIT